MVQRVTLEIITKAIEEKLEPESFVGVDSIKYMSTDNNLWTARVCEIVDDVTYYRIAEGMGKKVTSVSQRCTAYPKRFSGRFRTIASIKSTIQVEYEQLDWLFEDRIS